MNYKFKGAYPRDSQGYAPLTYPLKGQAGFGRGFAAEQ